MTNLWFVIHFKIIRNLWLCQIYRAFSNSNILEKMAYILANTLSKISIRKHCIYWNVLNLVLSVFCSCRFYLNAVHDDQITFLICLGNYVTTLSIFSIKLFNLSISFFSVDDWSKPILATCRIAGKHIYQEVEVFNIIVLFLNAFLLLYQLFHLEYLKNSLM